MMNRARIASILVLLVALLSAIPAPAAEPYEIGAILSLTGPGAFLGRDEVEALHVVEGVVNKSGGIGGRPLKLTILDDQSSPQLAVQLAAPLIARHDPLILGPSLTATCRAVAALVERSGPVTYCFTSGIKVKPATYVFSASFSTIDSMGATIRYMRRRGWTHIAYIVSTDATGQDAEESLNTILNSDENKSMMTVVDREHFNVGDLSAAAQMARIKAANPQAVIAWSTGTPLGTLVRSAHDAGLNLPIFTTGGNIEYAEMQQYGPFLPKEIYFSGCTGLTTTPVTDRGLRRAVAEFQRAFSDAGIRPEQGHILAWDATFFSIAGLRKLGPGATASQLQAYLDGLRGAKGAVGSYNFVQYPQRGLGIESVVIVRWDPAKGTWVGAGT